MPAAEDHQQGQLFEAAASPAAPVAPRSGAKRLRRPERDQLAYEVVCCDRSIPDDHPVRAVWELVSSLELGVLEDQVQAVEGGPGQAPADPALLLALWVWATIRGVSSARELDRLCREHLAYRWLCGGVTLNYHTLSDWRSQQGAALEELLTQLVAALLHQGLVTLERVAQDGLRTRASAGTASFRRAPTLTAALAAAEEQVARLAAEEASGTSGREQAARQRAARDRAERVSQALAELPDIAARKKPGRTKAGETAEEREKRTAPRASTTDPEARPMKHGDGGFRPSYNVNFATDCGSQVVVGVMVNNVGSDHGLMRPMAQQVQERCGRRAGAWLADNGYDKHTDLEALERSGTVVYLPPQVQRTRTTDRYTAQPGESAVIAGWRARMGTAAAQEIYRERAATAECVNAQARNRGLRLLPVRGLKKVHGVALLYAVAHNIGRMISLGVKLV